jgi:serine/threonine-protein kinase
MSLRAGDVLGSKYEVERLLGEGGMGLVVAARHRELGHRVAVKCLHASALGNEGAVVRFEREARAAAALTTEHVARVIDVERLEDGSPYMVMELLEGEDLHTMLRREGALSIVDTVRFASHAADGLAEAHAVGIVHRDVKPSNLFVTRRKKGGPVVKVLDFGIAKNVADSTDRGLTATQALLGSPQYMSPEQVRESKLLDARTDIWALGVTMYECLAGRKPFDAPSMVDLCFAIVQSPPPSLLTLRPDVPPKLEAVVVKCLAKNPDDRYATMSELADQLALILSHVSGEASTSSLRFAQAREALSKRSPEAFAATAVGERAEIGSLAGLVDTKASSASRSSKTSLIVASVATFLVLGGITLAMRPRDPAKEPSREGIMPMRANPVSGVVAKAPELVAPAAAPVAAPLAVPVAAPVAEGLEAHDAGLAASAAPKASSSTRSTAAREAKKAAAATHDSAPAKSKGLHMTIE